MVNPSQVQLASKWHGSLSLKPFIVGRYPRSIVRAHSRRLLGITESQLHTHCSCPRRHHQLRCSLTDCAVRGSLPGSLHSRSVVVRDARRGAPSSGRPQLGLPAHRWLFSSEAPPWPPSFGGRTDRSLPLWSDGRRTCRTPGCRRAVF